MSIIRLTEPDGTAAYPQLTPETFAGRIYNTASGNNQYQVFARYKKNTSTSMSGGVLLVTGLGGISSADRGVYLIQTVNRSSTFAVKITALATSSASVSFGWYEGTDGYFYLGALRNSVYSAPVVFVLDDTGYSGSYKIELDNHYQSATAPTGWTAITVS